MHLTLTASQRQLVPQVLTLNVLGQVEEAGTLDVLLVRADTLTADIQITLPLRIIPTVFLEQLDQAEALRREFTIVVFNTALNINGNYSH
jgi:hypothetical protein